MLLPIKNKTIHIYFLPEPLLSAAEYIPNLDNKTDKKNQYTEKNYGIN